MRIPPSFPSSIFPRPTSKKFRDRIGLDLERGESYDCCLESGATENTALAGLLATIIAVLNFIPVIGPVIGGVPAVLLALTEGPVFALWVVGLIVLVQVVEGNFLTPMVQSRTADLPPALLLLVQLLTGALFGLLGLALAAPLSAVGLVLVRRGYVEGWLGREPPGEG